MFIALEQAEKKPEGVLSRLRGILIRPRLWLEPAKCLGGRYALLKWEGRGEPDWNAVENICGTYANRLLLPEGMSPPPESRAKRLSMPGYENRVLMKTACEIIDRTRMPMYRRVLGFVDMGADYAFMLDKLLMHFTAVKVLTKNSGAYEEASAHIMDSLGAPMMLAGDLSSLDDCVLILSPGSVFTDMPAPRRCPVMAGGPFVANGKFCLINGLVAEPFREAIDECPDGINPHEFAGALYEYCGVEATSFIAGKLLYDYQIIGLDGAVARINSQ